MIDGRYKAQLDKLWNRSGVLLARFGATPNGVTLTGVVLSTANTATFLWHRNLLLYGVTLAATELIDNLDGAVARVTNRATRYGSYVDAVTDRCKEAVSLLAVGIVTERWLLVSISIAGSLLVSYNVARARAELTTTPNKGWPDLFERLERVSVLCAGLILAELLPPTIAFGNDALTAALVVLAVGTNVTAAQRFWRARALLKAEDLEDDQRTRRNVSNTT